MDVVVKNSYFAPTRGRPSPPLMEELILIFKDKFDVKVMLERMQQDFQTYTNTIQMLQILHETCPDDFNVFMNKFTHVRVLERGRYAISSWVASRTTNDVSLASRRRDSLFIDAEDFMKEVSRVNKSRRFWCILGVFMATALVRLHYLTSS